MSWFTEPSPPVWKQHLRHCAVFLCLHLSCPPVVSLSGSLSQALLPGNKLCGGTRLTGWGRKLVAGPGVTLHVFVLTGLSSASIRQPHRSVWVPCSRPWCSPGPALAPAMPLPSWMLYDKVIQRQLRALISGLNPVSAGASLSLLPPPGLLSSCPTPTAWLTI